ncbi:MAG: bifunctional riboflavin kinase/FAD synthetase [Bacteroidales bacterium]|nr:bifunctional riboflavin kinase/FAD synthetase [Bacteroidales bacterium]
MRVYEQLQTYSGKNPVVTIGMFDGVHLGHRQLIKRITSLAESIGGESVILTFWPHPRVFFEKDHTSLKLITTLEEKIQLLQTTGVSSVVIQTFDEHFSRMSPYNYIKEVLVERIGAKKIVVGYDHKYGYKGEGDFAFLSQQAAVFGFDVEEIPPFDLNHINISSTKTRESIEQGNIDHANKFLSYEYFLNGKVVKGRQIGRKIGYPTANIEVDSNLKLIPGSGVYVVDIKLDGKTYQGVASVGTNPTIEVFEKRHTIEAYIFNFNEDIYDRKLTLVFKTRIRDEKKFDSIITLKDEIAADVAYSKAWFNSRENS